MSQDNLEELYLNNVWRPSLSITGAEGLPPIATAGNVIRPSTTVRCSMRFPPSLNAHKGEEIMKKILTENPPYNCKVELKANHAGSGWCMKDLEPWFTDVLQEVGHEWFGKETGSYGEGGSIPFLNELGTKYPQTQIIALGVTGPHSNIHGPNENLNLKYVKKVIGALTHIVARIGKQ